MLHSQHWSLREKDSGGATNDVDQSDQDGEASQAERRMHAMVVQSGPQFQPINALCGCYEWTCVMLQHVNSHKEVWYTYIPHMKLALLGPRAIIMKIDTSLFSPPLSPHTRDSSPYLLTARRNVSNTVEELLLVWASNATAYQSPWY